MRHDWTAIALAARATTTGCAVARTTAPATAIVKSAPLKNLFRRASRPSLWINQNVIREELFSVERLEAHARSLAAAQSVAPKPLKGIR